LAERLQIVVATKIDALEELDGWRFWNGEAAEDGRSFFAICVGD